MAVGHLFLSASPFIIMCLRLWRVMVGYGGRGTSVWRLWYGLYGGRRMSVRRPPYGTNFMENGVILSEKEWGRRMVSCLFLYAGLLFLKF